jgi:hypothetical protein
MGEEEAMKKGSHHSKAALARIKNGCKQREKSYSPEARAAQLAALAAGRQERWGGEAAKVQQNKDQLSEKLKLARSKLTPEEHEEWCAHIRAAKRKPAARAKTSADRKAYMAQHPEVYENLITSQGPDVNKRKSEKMKAHWKVKKDAHSAAIRKGANKPQAKKRRSAASKRAMANNPALANRLGERNKQLWASRRPADWMEKPTDWRVIGTELLLKESMSNKELAARLDASRIAKCPYGDTWQASVKERGFEKFINQIRGWVRRPGKAGESKIAVNSPITT